MASHRKSRPAGTRVAGIRTPAIATAALTSVALLSQTADAAPSTDEKPSLEEVEKKVGDLYRQAETATEQYNAAKEKPSKQRRLVDTLLDDVAKRTQRLNEAREGLGPSPAAQNRTGTATFPQAGTPQDHVAQGRLMGRTTARERQQAAAYVTERPAAERQEAAARSLRAPTASQNGLKSSKTKVQKKLSDTRGLFSRLTAHYQAAREAAEPVREQRRRQETSDAPAADPTYATKAEKALAFARFQIGKPYVWGATGPGSYDGSGFTRAAWKSAGVALPRVTCDQAKAGTRVPAPQAEPGDLVFFHDDITHVGLYIGNGRMIHAPKPGAYVREESVYYDGASSIHSVVRPA